jgi:hypothetical protein
VTKNVLGISPMPPMVPDSQLMAPMTTDLINFTDNTKELGNSSAKACCQLIFFHFSSIFATFYWVGNTGFLS